MLHNRHFWLANNIGLSLYYIFAAILVLQGAGLEHIFVMIAAILLLIHFLETPMAYMVLKQKNPDKLRLLVMTVLFGFTWWLPAKLGVYAVNSK